MKAAPKAPRVMHREGTTETEPSVWISQRQNVDGTVSVAFGCASRGKSVRRQAVIVMETFRKMKHFAEVEVPAMTSQHKALAEERAALVNKEETKA